MRFGYHVSVSGAPVSAVVEGVDAGCETIQFFPGSPQQWGTTPVTDEEAAEFAEARAGSGIDPAIIHSIYLVNLAAPSPQVFNRSVGSLASALRKAERIGAEAVVTHIGNHKGEGEEFGLRRIAEGVAEVLRRAPGRAMLLLETTAGAGTSIGDSFEQFGRVFEMAGWPERLGFCLDTCHVFAAGYDISTPAGFDHVLEELDRHVGLERLREIHLNDCMSECGSRLDRHARIGRGNLGIESIRHIVNHPSLAGLPAIVEVHYGEDDTPDDLEILRSMRG